jgi:ribosomal protein S8
MRPRSATCRAFRVPVAASISAETSIKRVQGGLGISILTTPKGVMTGRQARREGVGGEILCEVW